MNEAFSEHQFLRWLRQRRQRSPSLELGIGDDAAQWSGAGQKLGDVLIANDAVLEGRHVSPGPNLATDLARKVVRSNVSDIAAMGGEPDLFFLSLKLSPGSSLKTAQSIIETVEAECETFGVVLAGGDTVVGEGGLWLSGTLLGHLEGPSCRRDGAKAGDLIVVSGALGGSILDRHLNFEPRLKLSRELMRLGPPSAMADISDGLSRDLMNILEASDAGACLDASAIPIHADAHRLAESSGQTALEHALHDGEDFELLFTVDPNTWQELKIAGNSSPGLSVIGKVNNEGEGMRLTIVPIGEVEAEVLVPRGFDHGS